jgi:6-phosphogluconolactonase (cycloisomerase 2 family)
MSAIIRIASRIVFLGTAILPAFGQVSCTTAPRTELYAAVGPKLVQYDLDLDAATLTQRGSVTVPENIQEATVLKAAPSQEYLYAAWSDGGPVNNVIPPGPHRHHGISAFRIDPASGALIAHGVPAMLPARPVFITTDTSGTHVLTAHPIPSSINVVKIMSNGTLGAIVPQPESLDFGVFGHQVRADPSGKTILLTTRGNPPTAKTPEDPGAIKIFSYKDGILGNLQSIAPGGGLNYQVRHLDFDPSGRWVYADLEKQSRIHVYRRMADGTLSAEPLFVRSTLMKTTPAGTGQTSSIHVNPNGKFVYVANRTVDGRGENSIAVFSIDQRTGEPTLIQSIATRGVEARTFTLDSCGKILAVGNQQEGTIQDNAGTVTTVPGSIALFRIGSDGRLEFARKYDVETTPERALFWVRAVTLP